MSTVDDRLAAITVAELDADPYPAYAWLREHAPVAWVPAVELWLVTTWQAVDAAARNGDVFSAGVTPSPLERTMGAGNILLIDGPPHRELRKAVEPPLRPRAVEARVADALAAMVDQYLDRLQDRGEAELMSELFEPISVRALAEMMGIGEVDDETLRHWFADMAVGATNFEGDPTKDDIGAAASADIDLRLRPIIERLAREPDDSMIAGMAAARGGSVEDRIAWMMPTIKITITGGMQEPGHASGSTVLGVLSRPDQAAAMRSSPQDLVRQAIEEGLRWMAPIGTQTRRTTTSTTLAGVELPAGANVGLLVSSASRDHTVFGDDAEEFDMFRTARPHGAFGFGAHFCPGHHVSRLQMRLAIAGLFERCRNLRLDDDRPPRVRGWEFRAPAHLHVRWDR